MVILKKFMEMDRNGDGQLDLKEFMRKNKEHTDQTSARRIFVPVLRDHRDE